MYLNIFIYYIPAEDICSPDGEKVSKHNTTGVIVRRQYIRER